MGQWRATAELPATPQGPAAARHAVSALLSGWQLDPLIEDAQLVVSELVTNAVLHAPGAHNVDLELLAHADRLRITVSDPSTSPPVLAPLQPNGAHGKGMHIISALAARWGIEDHPYGKRVWAELTLPHPGRRLTLA